MLSLNDIFNKNSSDKGTSFGEAHNYGSVYERLILQAPVMGCACPHVDLLEIGICDPRKHGASLVSWNEWLSSLVPEMSYFITGLDIVEAKEFENEYTLTLLADQSDRKQLLRAMTRTCHLTGPTGEPYDESYLRSFTHIIDDGSHQAAHQQISLGFLWPRLRHGGIYFIEDLHAAPATVEILKGFKDGTTRFDDTNMFPHEQVRLFDEIDRVEWFCSDKLCAIWKKQHATTRPLLSHSNDGQIPSHFC